jgi:hypothetical protein
MPFELMLAAPNGGKLLKKWKRRDGVSRQVLKTIAPPGRYEIVLYLNPDDYPTWPETLRKRGNSQSHD